MSQIVRLVKIKEPTNSDFKKPTWVIKAKIDSSRRMWVSIPVQQNELLLDWCSDKENTEEHTDKTNLRHCNSEQKSQLWERQKQEEDTG